MFQTKAFASVADCNSLVLNIISKSNSIEKQINTIKYWSNEENQQFSKVLETLKFNSKEAKVIIETLNSRDSLISFNHVKNYLQFTLTLKDQEKNLALIDLNQLEIDQSTSKYIKKYLKSEKTISKKVKAKKLTSADELERFHELYYGCRSFHPNEVNKAATKKFKKFNVGLSLGTLGFSYSYYNMDKEMNAEWFEKLGYDIAVSLLFSYYGNKAQTKVTDTQLTKTLKNYLFGRFLSLTDVLIYDPLFNNERDLAEKRIEAMKKSPIDQQEIKSLLESYEERGLYRKFKNEIVSQFKKLPFNANLGVSGNSIDENNIDWNNIQKSDLDRPVVQEVLVAAAMAQVYEQAHGEWIETSDVGLDRYTFNTLFYGAQMPRSFIQSYITYQMLCMGQDNTKVSFTKAVLFNLTSSFIVNHALYGYRLKAIGY
jgi:hypothetical protein